MIPDTIVTSAIADIFHRFGREYVLQMVDEWSLEVLEKLQVNPLIKRRISEVYPKKLPKMERVTSENMDKLVKESVTFRKEVRGESKGKLG